ncbi:ABC transporter permease [Arthrobacter sp.]|uniref:ABC transporter permease n=1 Tax=Arthrobacter sp. TaxID=1667 RepID=UPI002810A63B|nr:ABC transporter permease [Arthrobacter sp.]
MKTDATTGNPRAAGPASSTPRKAGKFTSPLGRDLNRRSYILTAILSFCGLVAVWTLMASLELVDPLFLPSPLAVLGKLGEQAASGELWEDMAVSTYRVFMGFLLASAMALPIGLLAGASRRLEAVIEPVIDFIRYMPVVAFVPLTILWVGTDDAQKFLIIWMGTFFQQVLMVSDAVRTVPAQFQNLGATLGLSRTRILLRIVFPASMPRIWDALRVTLGWAWTWLVVAELVAATSGMGYRITQAQRFLATDTIIGYVIVLGIIGLVCDQILRISGRKLFRYTKGR